MAALAVILAAVILGGAFLVLAAVLVVPLLSLVLVLYSLSQD